MQEHSSQQDSTKHSLNPLHLHQAGSAKQILTVAWPIIIGVLSYTAMGVADTMFVGRLGTAELAAVGIASTVVLALNAFFLGVIDGVKVAAAQAFGAQKHRRTLACAWHGMALALPLGLLVISTLWIEHWIFQLVGGPAHIQEMARSYFQIRIWGAPFWYMMSALCNYDKALGNTKTPMMITLVANIINIILNGVLIFGLGPIPAFGLEGAAMATVIASICGMLMALTLFFVRRGLKPHWETGLTRDILKLGLPMGVEFGLDMASFTIITAMIAHMGEAQLAANQVAIRIMSVSFMPGYGISEAACILAGQYAGAKDRDAIHKVYWSSLKIGMGLMGAIGLCFWVFPEPLMNLFQSDDGVTAIGIHLLMLAAVLQIVDAVAMVTMGVLNGVGDTQFTMKVSILSNWIVMIPTAYLLGIVFQGGVFGVWIAMMLMILLFAILCMWRFIQGGWVPGANLEREDVQECV